MQSTLRILGLLVVLAFAAASSLRAHAPYINHTECSFHAAGGTYLGPAGIVAAGSGRVNAHCNAKLTAGTKVATATHTTVHLSSPHGALHCDVVVTPSGNANVSCHKD